LILIFYLTLIIFSVNFIICLFLYLQLKPNFEIENITENSSQRDFVFGLVEENCPEGTIPILRSTKDNFTQKNNSLNDHMLMQGIIGVHVRYLIQCYLHQSYMIFNF